MLPCIRMGGDMKGAPMQSRREESTEAGAKKAHKIRSHGGCINLSVRREYVKGMEQRSLLYKTCSHASHAACTKQAQSRGGKFPIKTCSYDGCIHVVKETSVGGMGQRSKT